MFLTKVIDRDITNVKSNTPQQRSHGVFDIRVNQLIISSARIVGIDFPRLKWLLDSVPCAEENAVRIEHSGYEDLLNAIILRALYDIRDKPDKYEKDVISFFNSKWFREISPLDTEYIAWLLKTYIRHTRSK